MKATILITGEEKEKYLIKTIKSCLNQSYTKIEIILIYSNLRNLNKIKQKFKKKIRFLKIKKKLIILLEINFIKFRKDLRFPKESLFFYLMETIFLKKIKLKILCYIKIKMLYF